LIKFIETNLNEKNWPNITDFNNNDACFCTG
jgi:hypothetical protein